MDGAPGLNLVRAPLDVIHLNALVTPTLNLIAALPGPLLLCLSRLVD
jgi:hypothetical protein